MGIFILLLVIIFVVLGDKEIGVFGVFYFFDILMWVFKWVGDLLSYC